MKNISIRSMLAGVVVLLPAIAFANGLDDFLAFNQNTKSASGRFEQQVMDRAGKVVERGSGSFMFARPGKFRWVYDKPHPQTLVADGTKLYIYDPELQQVTVKRMDQAISSTPAALLAGREDIASLFSLRDGGSANGLEWVEATPRTPDTGFDRVRLGLKDRQLAAMELFDQLGGHSALRFVELTPNAPVPADAFRFTPPKGADVIEDAPPRR
jgi:outer membrane lipoprotein carrier protein